MPTLTLALWGLATLLTLVILFRGVIFNQIWQFPFFFLYLFVNLLQAAITFFLYRSYGFTSSFTFPLAWTTQGIVVIARALAAVEVCFLILGHYKGVWALASRILGFSGVLVLALALYFGKNGYAHGIITLEVGLEAAIATGIAGLFVFARYYQILVAPATGQLGLGLGILSCFKILNDLFLQKFARAIGFNWNHASFCTFVAVLLVWMWALRKPIAMRIPNPIMKSAAAYSNLMPQVNQRLAELNDQLAHLWQLESPKS